MWLVTVRFFVGGSLFPVREARAILELDADVAHVVAALGIERRPMVMSSMTLAVAPEWAKNLAQPGENREKTVVIVEELPSFATAVQLVNELH